MSRLKIAGALTAGGLLAVALVGGWEGKRNHAYRDIVGVWTLCYGETRGVRKGDYRTDAQCDAMLADALVDYETGIRRCLLDPDAIPIRPYVSFVSLAYNIGIGSFCRSSIARLANAGEMRAACNALMLYVRAGGKVVKGLVNRREDEREFCLKGLNDA